MKIAEYIDLVKQAELIDLNGNSRTTVNPPPFQGAVEPNRSGKPPVDPRVEQAINSGTNPFVSSEESKRRTEAAEREYDKPKEPLRLSPEQTGAKTSPSSEVYYERPRINPETQLPYINPKTNLMEPKRYGFLQKPSGEPGFGVTIPKFNLEPVDSPAYQRYKDHYSNRSVGLWAKDLFSREAWKDWWNNSAKEALKKQLNAEADFINGQLNQEVKFKPRLSFMDGAFSVGIPVSLHESNNIAAKSLKDSNKYNLGPKMTLLDYLFVRTPEGIVRQSPNIVGEYLNFGVNPLATVNMATMPINFFLPEHYQLPSFYELHYDDNRVRNGEYTPDDYYYDPNLIEKQDKIYQNPNRIADYVGAVVDPFLQWMPGYDKGFGLGLKQRSDNGGIDYQAALEPVLGSKSWDTLHGQREGYSKDKEAELINQAIKNGFSVEEANGAAQYYKDKNSRYANALLMMATAPEDLYNTGWVLDTIKEPIPDKSIPEYLPGNGRSQFGPALYDPNRNKPQKNPEWLKEQLRLQRQITDQQVFKELYPFFNGIIGTGKTMSDEEAKFIDTLLKASEEDVHGWLDSIKSQPTFNSTNWVSRLREISELPPYLRYAYLAKRAPIWDPDAENSFHFVEKYYHPKDRERVLRALRRLNNSYLLK